MRIVDGLIALIQVILYLLLQIIFLPLAIVGLIVGAYKGIVRSKRMGVSFSACRALQYRWIMHSFQTRPDPLSVAFVRKFPCESHFGLWSVFGALILSQRIFGFTTRLGVVDETGEETYLSFAGPRVLMFDRILEKYLDQVEQIVLPGAGFDLISLRYTRDRGIKVLSSTRSRPSR